MSDLLKHILNFFIPLVKILGHCKFPLRCPDPFFNVLGRNQCELRGLFDNFISIFPLIFCELFIKNDYGAKVYKKLIFLWYTYPW